MKKIGITIGIIFSIFPLFSCATLKPERSVQENVFTSTYPEIKVKVSPDYKYFGDITKIGDWRGTEIMLNGKSSYYPFVITENKKIKKSITIEIDRINGYFIKNSLINSKVAETALEYGEDELNGEKFQFYTMPVIPSADRPLTKYFLDKGYDSPECLVKIYGRRSPQGNKYYEKVIFLESLEGTGYPYNTWKNKSNLTPEQYKILEDFGDRCKKAITFSDASPRENTSFTEYSSEKNTNH